MPFKDEFGIWRHDVPTDKRESMTCKRCGSDMEVDLLSEDDNYDDQLEQDYPELFSGDDWHPLLSYQRCHAECHNCGRIVVYGPRWYYNPTTNWYDLPRPLSLEQAKQAEFEAQRASAKAAGQLELFPDQEATR